MVLDLLLDEDDDDIVGVDEAAFLTVLGIMEVTPPPEVVGVDLMDVTEGRVGALVNVDLEGWAAGLYEESLDGLGRTENSEWPA